MTSRLQCTNCQLQPLKSPSRGHKGTYKASTDAIASSNSRASQRSKAIAAARTPPATGRRPTPILEAPLVVPELDREAAADALDGDEAVSLVLAAPEAVVVATAEFELGEVVEGSSTGGTETGWPTEEQRDPIMLETAVEVDEYFVREVGLGGEGTYISGLKYRRLSARKG